MPFLLRLLLNLESFEYPSGFPAGIFLSGTSLVSVEVLRSGSKYSLLSAR